MGLQRVGLSEAMQVLKKKKKKKAFAYTAGFVWNILLSLSFYFRSPIGLVN